MHSAACHDKAAGSHLSAVCNSPSSQAGRRLDPPLRASCYMIMLARGQIDREELAPARNKDATIIRQLASGRRRPHGIDLECANIIAKLSEQVSLDAGDIIMTGTQPGAALSPGRQNRMRGRRRRHAEGHDRQGRITSSARAPDAAQRHKRVHARLRRAMAVRC